MLWKRRAQRFAPTRELAPASGTAAATAGEPAALLPLVLIATAGHALLMHPTTIACLAAALALAAAPLAAALSSQPANEGIPPGFAGLWAEEREGTDGGPAMILSRQWLPDGNGFVMYTQVTGAGWVLGLST